MVIKHIRIDDRLIHGQVTVAWAGTVGVDHIICVNDKVAADPIQKMLLPQAARGVKASVLTLNEADNYLQSEKARKERVMIIAKHPADALALLEKGVETDEIDEINVGNQAPRVYGKDLVRITRTISINLDDAETYRKIVTKGYKLTAKMMPSDAPVDIIKLLEKKGA